MSVKSGDILEEVTQGKIVFPLDLPVSKLSKFGDDVWSWEDFDNARLKSYQSSDLKFDWKNSSSIKGLSENIIQDLKKFIFLRFTYPKIFFPKARISHPATIIREMRMITAFLSRLCRDLTVGNICLVNWLTDIEVEDLRNCLASYDVAPNIGLKNALKSLSSETFSKYLGGRKIKWNRFDIQALPWKKKQIKEFERMPEELFSLLSNHATKDVRQFLEALEQDVQDKTSIDISDNLYLSAFSNFKERFTEYKAYREGRRSTSYRYWKKYIRGVNAVKEFYNLICRARQAAQIIIMLYTGARASELASFKLDCLIEKDEGIFLVGTVIKGVGIHEPTYQDEWVAIPIVCDAVSVLRQIAGIVKTNHLFQMGNLLSDGREVLTSSHIASSARSYLKIIDIDGQWNDFCLRSHQFRNNLAFEMRKAELGLPFITHQLKHVSDSLKKFSTSSTTLLYGNLSRGGVRNAIQDANLVALKEIYHPDAPVTGGGATEHRMRRKAYFEGMAAQGIGIDESLRKLALGGFMPLTDVGLGYCQGQVKIVVDGVKTDPPCIGSLRCNPIRCGNAVIPSHKISAWVDIAEANRARANDPEFSHARSYLLEAVQEAEAVIQFIQIEKRKK